MMKFSWSRYIMTFLAVAFLAACQKSSSFNDTSLSSKIVSALSVVRSINQTSYTSAQSAYTKPQLEKALRIAANTLINRDTTAAETASLSGGVSVYESLIKTYLDDPAFLTTQFAYYRGVFEMGGTTNGINYDEPSNLAIYLIKNDLSFQQMLTADFCVDNNFNVTTCASFGGSAPMATAQGAGAITTQAFLSKWAASFNFRRVKKTFKIFACREYPDAGDVGLTVAEVSGTVKTFNCTTCTPACFSCHKAMNSRAALFYNFGTNGVYTTNTATSTLTDTGAASTKADLLVGNTKPIYHGTEVQSVKEYATLLSQNKTFRDCLAQRMVNYMMSRGTYDTLLPDFQNVRDDVEANGYSVKKILLEIAMHPAFVNR